jgi:hypothetical protein
MVASNHSRKETNNGSDRSWRTARRSSCGRPRISFSIPYSTAIRSKASLAIGEAGYFGEKLQAAHRQLIALWKRRSAQLQPNFKQTDIFGVLLTAEHIFNESPHASRKVLVIFSDMRHSTAELDFESGNSVPSFAQLKHRSDTMPVAALKGVEVYALGVDGAGKPISYWQSLQTFWREYFEETGAALRDYSVLRDVPSLTGGTPVAKTH